MNERTPLVAVASNDGDKVSSPSKKKLGIPFLIGAAAVVFIAAYYHHRGSSSDEIDQLVTATNIEEYGTATTTGIADQNTKIMAKKKIRNNEIFFGGNVKVKDVDETDYQVTFPQPWSHPIWVPKDQYINCPAGRHGSGDVANAFMKDFDVFHVLHFTKCGKDKTPKELNLYIEADLGVILPNESDETILKGIRIGQGSCGALNPW